MRVCLLRPDSEVCIFFCWACGSYAQNRTVAVKRHCPGAPTAARRTIHMRLRSGFHPTTKVPLLAPHTWRLAPIQGTRHTCKDAEPPAAAAVGIQAPNWEEEGLGLGFGLDEYEP
jgi:hypothetical protein